MRSAKNHVIVITSLLKNQFLAGENQRKSTGNTAVKKVDTEHFISLSNVVDLFGCVIVFSAPVTNTYPYRNLFWITVFAISRKQVGPHLAT